MDALRIALAALALSLGAAMYALNAIVSFQERGFVEPLDVPLALALGVAAAFAWRRSRWALRAGAALSVVALLLVVPSGAMPLMAFWVLTLALAMQALPLARGAGAT